MNNLESDPGDLNPKSLLKNLLSKFYKKLNNDKVSQEEVMSLISQSQENGCINHDEKQMIEGVFSFNDKMAREIMTPRNNIFAIDIEDDIDYIIDSVIECGYSRIPVYKDSIDNIIGILYTKDLLAEARKIGFKDIDIQKIIQDPFFILETQKTNDVFKMLKENKVHLALLFDEYGGVAGLVTMEDLIEEIMGDIEDEHDNEELIINQIDENNFYIKGNLSVSDFNSEFDINLEEGEYDTINGYLLTKLGKLPKEGTLIELDQANLLIDKVDNRKIQQIKITLKRSIEST